MAAKKRFIQVGLGGWGGAWVKGFGSRLVNDLGIAEAAAVVDINPDTFPRAMEKYHVAAERCYTDARKAFKENDADFAIIVVPPAFHEKIVDLALARGMHILSEKPIADTMAACCRIYKKVKKARRKMAVTMSHRFDQDKQTLERLARSGRYGKVDYIVGRNTWDYREFGKWGDFRYRIPDALLVEGAVHHFDICRALAGSDAATVYARTWNPKWSDFAGDSQGLILIEMKNGVKVFYEGAKCNATMLNGWRQDYWRAECDKGTLVLDNRNLRVMTGAVGTNARIEEVPLDDRPAWMNSLIAEQFVNWLSGGPAPATSLDDNIQCAALLFAAIESAHKGTVVDVQRFLKTHMAAARA